MRYSLTPIFLTLFFILALAVSGFALLKTSLISFNIALFCYSVFGVFKYRSDYFSKDLISPVWVVIPIIFFIFYILKYSVFYNAQVQFPNLPHNDILHYLSISDGLSKYGQENFFRFKNDLFSEFNGLIPYHYFDLWLNALISSSLSVNNFFSWHLIMHPLLLTMCALAYMSLYEVQNKLNWKGVLLALGFCFYCGLPLEAPKFVLSAANPFLFSKSIVSYIFIIITIIFLYRNLKLTSISTLLVLTWIYPTVAPGIYIGLTLFFTYSLLLKREGWNYNYSFALIFISAILHIGFYKTFGSKFSPESSTSIIPLSLSEIFLSFKQYASQCIKMIVRYIFPLSRLYFLNRRFLKVSTLEKQILEFFLVIVVSGIFFSGLPQGSLVASQFGANLMGCILIVLSFMFFQKVIEEQLFISKLSVSIIVILISFSFLLSLKSGFYTKPSRIEQFSKTYIKSVEDKVHNSANTVGVFIADSIFFEGSVLNKNEDYHYVGKYLKAIRQNVYVINLMPDKLLDTGGSNTEMMFYDRSVFASYKRRYPLIQNDSLRIFLIKDMKPEFLLATKNSKIPKYLKRYLSDSIVDQRSGDRFFMLIN